MRVLVASPNGTVTDVLRSMLTGLDPHCEVEVIDSTPSHLSSPPARHSTSPDLVLADMDGVSADINAVVQGLLLHYPETPLVALGSRLDDAYVEEILEAGALGYLPKSYSETVARGVLRLVLSGGAYRPYASPTESTKTNTPAQLDEVKHELLYRRLMSCYLKRGEFAGVLNTYQRCREALSKGLAAPISGETERIHLDALRAAGQSIAQTIRLSPGFAVRSQ